MSRETITFFRLKSEIICWIPRHVTPYKCFIKKVYFFYPILYVSPNNFVRISGEKKHSLAYINHKIEK